MQVQTGESSVTYEYRAVALSTQPCNKIFIILVEETENRCIREGSLHHFCLV